MYTVYTHMTSARPAGPTLDEIRSKIYLSICSFCCVIVFVVLCGTYAGPSKSKPTASPGSLNSGLLAHGQSFGLSPAGLQALVDMLALFM